jgi:hypothetical protein
MERIRLPKDREGTGKRIQPGHVLVALDRAEGIGEVAAELFAVDDAGHFSSLATGTLNAFASFSSTVSVGSWRAASRRQR